MSYQKSEKCYYMGLKSAVEWKVPDNETCADLKGRYDKVLSINLRQKAYQRARDNNIKRWLELLGTVRNESPYDYIDKMVQAYVSEEIKITDIFIQSSTNPSRPGSAPHRCYLLGKRNIIKIKSYEKIENDVGESKAIGSLLLADFCLIFEIYDVDNKYIEKFVTAVTSNTAYYLTKVMDYWEVNIKEPETKTSNQQAVKTVINSDYDSEMYSDTDDETEELEATGSIYKGDECSTDYNNDSDVQIGEELSNSFEDNNYDCTNDSDVQIGKNPSESSEYGSYSDLTDNLKELM